jgi:hypothetical protein
VFIDLGGHLIDLCAWLNICKIFISIFTSVSIYSIINRNSDARFTIADIYHAIRNYTKEVVAEVWTAFKSAVVSMSKILSIIKLMELMFVGCVLMLIPKLFDFIIKTSQKLSKI